MDKKTVSEWQLKCTISLFIVGSSVVLGGSTETAQDSWIALIFSLVYVLPIVLIYARICSYHPGKAMGEVLIAVLGNFWGKVAVFFYLFYSIHLGALVLRNFSEFVSAVSLQKTPQIVTGVIMMFVSGYLAASELRTIGKWSAVVFPLVVGIVIITLILSMKDMEVENMFPILESSFGEVARSGYFLFAFPFAETVLCITLFSGLKQGGSPCKVYLWSVGIGAMILMAVIIRNLWVLGGGAAKIATFPSYNAARIIEVSPSIARLEGSISFNFILAGITKITICLLCGTKLLASLLNIKEYRQLMAPTALLMLTISRILYNNTMEMFDFIKIYHLYAVPFQIILPLIVLIAAELKKRKKERSAKGGAPAQQPT